MKQPIRILQVVTKMDRAGLETMLMNYYRHIDRSKVQFDFLTHRSEHGAYDDEIQSLGGRIYHTYPISPKYLIRYLKELEQFFKEHPEYKIVHSHLDALSAYPLYAAKKADIPVRIAHSHNCNFDKDVKLPFRVISKHLIPLVATNFWGCSKPAIAFMFGKKIAFCKKSVVLPNAIDAKKFMYDPNLREQVRTSLNIKNKFVIGHVGRFTYQKNHEFLIEIFAEIHKKNADSVLMLIGDGEEKDKIIKKVHSLGLQDNVLFMGVRDDIPGLMQAMDVFLFPSRFEGLGIVLIEAQAAGLPCVASKDVIPEEVNITKLVKFVSLNELPQKWAEVIQTRDLLLRENNTIISLREKGYDIVVQSQKLQNNYLAM